MARIETTTAFGSQLDQVVERGGELWRSFDGQPIFITGGTGFFGRWLLESLVRAQIRFGLDLHVAVLTRSPTAFQAKAPRLAASRFIHLIDGDVRHFTAPPRPFRFIIHGAATSAKATFDGEDPLEKFETAFDGTRRVLDSALASDGARVLVLGSGSVYGSTSGPVDERHPTAPLTLDTAAGLAHGKRAAEFLCGYYANEFGLPVTIARCFSFVGAYLPMNIHYAIGNFIKNAIEDEAITVRGDGTPLRSYLFAGDLVIWLLTLLVRGKPRAIYNVGSDRPVTLARLAELVGSVIAPAKPVKILNQPAAGPRNTYIPIIDLARTDLGLDVWTTLEDGIRHTADAFRQDRWSDG